MKRKAQYADVETRIISVQSTNLWRVQRLGPGKGTREFDPWVNGSKPLPYQLAKGAAGFKS